MPRPRSSRRTVIPFPRRTFVVGRVAGIEIAVHVTWFAILVLLAFAARYGIIPEVAPNLSAGATGLLSIGFALLFYVFVLAHEFAHAVVARAYGLRAGRITLFFFGGVAQIGREARNPGEEFRVAIAGPLASLIMAGALAAVSRLLHPGVDGFPGLWGAFAAINLALALFNLIPGFPLDGGRILRSALWAGTRDRARATRWAAVGGKVVAFGLMGSGAVLLVTGGGSGRGAVPGLWGLMLGWFLYGMAGGAASAEGGATPSEGQTEAHAEPHARPRRRPRPPKPAPSLPNERVQPLAADTAEPESGSREAGESPVPLARKHEDPRDAALRLDRVLFGDDEPVRAEQTPAKVSNDEGEAASSDASGGSPGAKKGAGPARASSAQPRSRSGHPR